MKYDFIKARVIAVSEPVVTEIPDAEGVITFAARVSNPSNQNNFETSAGLLNYCKKHNHWSIFEQATATIEIEAPRDITRQILRHRTASFQEFSQRYASVTDESFINRELRLQDMKNRQNSVKLSNATHLTVAEKQDLLNKWLDAQQEVIDLAKYHYNRMVDAGVAKEVARVLLPEGLTMSRMYMTANLRTWMHYCDVRESNGTQLEHIAVAEAAHEALAEYFPTIMNEVLNESGSKQK